MAKPRTIAASRVRAGMIVLDSCGIARRVSGRCELKGSESIAGIRSEVHEYWIWLESGEKYELKAGDRVAVPESETNEA